MPEKGRSASPARVWIPNAWRNGVCWITRHRSFTQHPQISKKITVEVEKIRLLVERSLIGHSVGVSPCSLILRYPSFKKNTRLYRCTLDQVTRPTERGQYNFGEIQHRSCVTVSHFWDVIAVLIKITYNYASLYVFRRGIPAAVTIGR